MRLWICEVPSQTWKVSDDTAMSLCSWAFPQGRAFALRIVSISPQVACSDLPCHRRFSATVMCPEATTPAHFDADHSHLKGPRVSTSSVRYSKSFKDAAVHRGGAATPRGDRPLACESIVADFVQFQLPEPTTCLPPTPHKLMESISSSQSSRRALFSGEKHGRARTS